MDARWYWAIVEDEIERTNMKTRRQEALELRRAAAQAAHDRTHPVHTNNAEEYRYTGEVAEHPEHPGETCAPTHLANFTKGLPHDSDGCVANHEDYERFVTSIQSGNPRDFRDVPLGPYEWQAPKGGSHTCHLKLTKDKHHVPCNPKGHVSGHYWLSDKAKNAEGGKGARVRAWESAGAGHQFELEGPDPQAVTMPPAPTLDSPELAGEMAEVYVMALLRDLSFTNFKTGGGADAITFKQALDYLSKFTAIQARYSGGLSAENLLRGLAPGDDVGPYVSQYLLVGSNEQNMKGEAPAYGPEEGLIRYGSIRVDQRVRAACAQDYMRTWEEFIDVQNGADLRELEAYENEERFRFISRPRDLATYVHYDALYEAYLNACLILLDQKVPFDRGIPFQQFDQFDKQQGFAHFGGPHILTLVTEVATRALKAVRYQKFNVHRRARPEAIAGLLERYRVALEAGESAVLAKLAPVASLYDTLNADEIKPGKTLFDVLKEQDGGNILLPMAFCEGSPMHPAYGAGHATVAGACVTILKAFFDHGHQIKGTVYEATETGDALQPVSPAPALTVEGELNKLAANISIGRNWAGVHYWSDYTESLRMGEEIALGILEEQKLTYRENFRMTVPLFNGGARMI